MHLRAHTSTVIACAHAHPRTTRRNTRPPSLWKVPLSQEALVTTVSILHQSCRSVIAQNRGDVKSDPVVFLAEDAAGVAAAKAAGVPAVAWTVLSELAKAPLDLDALRTQATC